MITWFDLYSSKSGVAVRSTNLARMATENSAAALMGKPKLMRQAAILADGDSTGSGKSVTFQVRTRLPNRSPGGKK